MADDTKGGETPALQKVYVRSIPRAGFGGSWRAGRFFSSAGFQEFEGTAEQIAQVKADAGLLIVLDQRPSDDAFVPAQAGAEGLPKQAGAPPGSAPPPESVHQQGLGDAAPHDAFAPADRGPKPSGPKR